MRCFCRQSKFHVNQPPSRLGLNSRPPGDCNRRLASCPRVRHKSSGSPLNGMSNPDLATRPVFVHVHVPKSGGTSLNQLLNHWFRGRIQWMQFSDPTRMFTQGEMDDYVWRNSQVDCITSHHFRVFPPVIAGRPALYLALLRNPVDYLISLARHTVQEKPKLTPEFRSVLPANLDELNVAELLSYWVNEA